MEQYLVKDNETNEVYYNGHSACAAMSKITDLMSAAYFCDKEISFTVETHISRF